MKKILSFLAVGLVLVGCSSNDTPQPVEQLISVFTAAPATVASGDSATLVISAVSGTTLTIDHGVGTVTGKTQVSVTPTATTTYKLTATKGGQTQTANATVTVGPKPALGYAIVAPATNPVAGVAFNVSVTATDASGQTAGGYTGRIHLSSDDGQAVLPADFDLTAADNGQKTVSVTFKTAGSRVLVATDANGSSRQGFARIGVDAAAATQLSLAASSTSVPAGATVALNVTARDAFGNVATGYTGTLATVSGDSAATLPAPTAVQSADQGRKALAASFASVGTWPVTVSDSSNSSLTATVQITVGTAASSQIVVAGPTNADVDVPTSFTITVKDRFGNVMTGYTGTVHVTSSDAAATGLGDVSLIGADQGVKSIPVTFATAASQSLTVTDAASASLSGSAIVNVRPGSATHFALSAMPATALAGDALSLTITALDAHGNVATAYAGSAHLSSADASDQLSADGAFVNGVRTVSLAYRSAGPHQVHVSEVGGTISADSSSTQVSAAGAVALLVSSGGSSVAGAPASVTVTVKDAFGNTVTDYAGTVHVTSSDAAAAPIADVTFAAADQGVMTIPVTFVTAADQTVTVTDAANASLSGSTHVSVNAGSATSYALSAMPATARAGDALSLTITALDAYGNVAKDYAGSAHVSSSDASDLLPADGGFLNGVHTVSLAYRLAGPHQVNVSEVGGTISADSTATQVSAGAAVALLVNSGSAVAGAQASVTVTAKDAFGNTVTDYAGTIAFASNDSAATLPMPYVFGPGDAGSATFAVTFATAGAQQLTVQDVSLSATGNWNVTPAAPASCGVTELATSTTAGTELSARVTWSDAFGNIATGYLGTVTATSSDGAATLPAATAFSSADQGTHVFTLKLVTAGNESVSFTDGAITCGASVDVSAGAALVKVTLPTDANAGVTVNGTVAIQDSYGNPVSAYAGTVSFTSTDTTAPASLTFTGSEGGTAPFTAQFSTRGAQTITAQGTGATNGTATVNVHGLVYTNPATGGRVRLVVNAAGSSAGLVRLDLVSNTALVRSQGIDGSIRGGVFSAGMNLPVDVTRVVTAATPITEGNVFTPAGPTTKVFAAALPTSGPTAGVLYSLISAKSAGTGGTTNDFGLSTGQTFYSVYLQLNPTATVGTVFDGQALGAKFRAAARSINGNDVIVQPDFVIGKLEVL